MAGDLQEAIALIKSGQKDEGQNLLIQILEEDPQNDKAWIWMSAVVDTDEMRLECLEEALKINPNNQAAQKGAAKLREKLPPPEPIYEEEFTEEYDEAYDDDFTEDDSWYDPIEPEPVSTVKETFSYDDYTADFKSDIEPQGKPNTTKKRSVLVRSPWLTIWYMPRITMRAILDTDPKKDVLLIAILIGLVSFFSGMLWAMMSTPDLVFMLIGLGITVILGPIVGLAWLYIMGGILWFTGMLLGGQGTAEEIRTALAWGNIPTLAFSALLIPVMLIFGVALPSPAELMLSDTVAPSAGPLLTIASCLFLLTIPLFLYGFYYVFLQSLGEAHQFSGWRAFGSVLLPGIIFNCVIWLAAFIAGLGTAL